MNLSRLLNLASLFAEITLSRFFAVKPATPLSSEECSRVRRILVFGYFGLGDAVMILPMLRTLHLLFPEAKLDCIASRRTAAYHVLRLAGIFDTIHFFEFKNASFGERRRMNQFLTAQGYDCVICSYTAPIEYFVPFLRSAPRRAGHSLAVKGSAKTHLRPDWLLHYRTELLPDEQIHETERYARIVRALAAGADVTAGSETFRFFTTPVASKRHSAPHIAVHAAVSPALNWKNWGNERFIQLCKRLVNELNATVTLLGDASEREALEEMSKAIAETDDKTNTDRVCVSTPRAGDHSTESLAETCRVLASCDAFVGNESGLGHIAMALGIPSVRIFGMTDYASFRALDAPHTDIRKDLPCSPCFVLGQIKKQSLNMHTCGHRNCLNTISVEEVFNAVAEKLPSRA